MKHCVYILKCADGSFYTGYARDVVKRLAQHNGVGSTKADVVAGAKYTRGRRPVQLVYQEEFATRSEAMQREYAIKQLSRTAKVELVRMGKGSK